MAPYVPSRSEVLKERGIPQKRLPSLHKGPYRGDVSALCLVSSPQRHLLLAGTGAQVLLYDLITGDLLYSWNVFDGVRVHGIYSGPAFGNVEDSPTSQVAFKMSTIVIHGERRVKLFKMLWRHEEETPQLHSLGSLPRFCYWVMDVRILQEKVTTSKSALVADVTDLHLLTVGLSNNTICIWDLLNSAMIYRVECSERCLLYSMKLWGDSLEMLHAGAGTVFNEVLVWKLGSNLSAVRNVSNVLTKLGNSNSSTEHERGENRAQGLTDNTSPELVVLEEVVHPLQRLLGHEGSIHRITWSSDGLSLVSVSDDRSARVWCAKKVATGGDAWLEGAVAGPVLYGHKSRLWDCYVGEKLLITASEDCTCRVWTTQGKYLATLKGHIGRGIWRCVYDSEVNGLVTAGADSSIKVQLLDKWVPRASKCDTVQDIVPSIQSLELQSFSVSPPWLNGTSEGLSGFMDSKSEYVRCLALSSPWSLYVSTNQGAVYHVHLRRSKEAFWTLLSDDLEGPIVCMDVLVQGKERDGSSGWNDFPNVDMVVVGTGKGSVTVMQVRRTAEQWNCEWRYTWVVEKERQLLGVYFCKSLGGRHVFTTDPRGTWRMWHVSERKVLGNGSLENRSSLSCCTGLTTCSNEEEDSEEYTAGLIACGTGSHARVLCIDVCPDLQLLVCGDKRGDLAAFLLPKDLYQWTLDEKKVGMNAETEALTELPVVAVFKGAHGISAVASVSVLPSNHCQHAEIISTGSDGCICRFLLELNSAAAMPRNSKHLLCTGIEKVAALSIVECLKYCKGVISQKLVEKRIAAGFAGSDFLLWDLTHQCEVMRVICGGWRRPHSVLVADLPELPYGFVFIKDQVVQVQRNWVTAIARDGGSACENSPFSGLHFLKTVPKMTTQSLRGQFHGKEISSVLFLESADDSLTREGSNPISWIATGSEDGTVIISRYTEDAGEQLDPTWVLGDHVGGSAVRALALVTDVHLIPTGGPQSSSADSAEGKVPLFGHGTGSVRDKLLLFSAGAKEILTCWLFEWLPEGEGDESSLNLCGSAAKLSTSLGPDAPLPRHRVPSSQWLSTHIPERVHPSLTKMTTKGKETISVVKIDNHEALGVEEENCEQRRKQESSSDRPEDEDDNQRYLALTAFGMRCSKIGTSIAFVATASSNATLHLYAFHVTHRSWVESAVLEYDTALVLAIEHFVAPFSIYGLGGRDVYIIITGATNGNIALWDVTNLVHQNRDFDGLDSNTALVAPLRPLTGRGSQGGRRRRKTAEQPSTSLSSKHIEGKSAGRENTANLDPLRPVFLSGSENEIPDAGNSRGVSISSTIQPSNERAEIKPSLRLNPLQELTAAHQSGINCMAVARIQRAEKCASSKMVYLVMSGGDDQALHLATFTLEMNHSSDFGSAERPETESSSAPMVPPVLRCLSKSSVPCAHNSSVKGVWTDGFWAFSTGLDQRLRCWRINADVACSELQPDSCEVDYLRRPKAASPLAECVTCVIDVPEPASLHVKHCLGGLYQIAVVGRGLQVIKFDSSSLSCEQLQR